MRVVVSDAPAASYFTVIVDSRVKAPPSGHEQHGTRALTSPCAGLAAHGGRQGRSRHRVHLVRADPRSGL